MNSNRAAILALLLLWPIMGTATEPPFEFGGLHIHLGFEEAVARVETFAGPCELGTLQRGEILSAQCDLATCNEASPKEQCPFTIAGLPVIAIALEARADAARMTRVMLVFDGDPEQVKASFLEEFGSPASGGSHEGEKSWSHARRLQWRSDRDNLGLLLTSRMITLTSNSPLYGEPPEAP